MRLSLLYYTCARVKKRKNTQKHAKNTQNSYFFADLFAYLQDLL